MNTLDALKLMVKSYPGGYESLAPRVNKNPETLRKELSGLDPKFKLGDTTAQLISDLCIEANSPNCYAYVNAVNHLSGGFAPLPVGADEVGPDVMTSTVALVSGTSQLLIDVTAAAADRIFSDNERKLIEKHAHEVIANMQALLREVARQNEAGKPAALRSI